MTAVYLVDSLVSSRDEMTVERTAGEMVVGLVGLMAALLAALSDDRKADAKAGLLVDE